MAAEIPRRGSVRPITDLPITTDPTGVVEIEQGGEFFQINSDLLGGGDPALVPPQPPTDQDDAFTGSVLDPKWTWHNQGTSTAALYQRRCILTLQSSGGGAAWRGITQVIPPAIQSGWAIRTYLSDYSSVADCSGGLWCRRTANGRFLTFVDILRTSVPTALLADMWAVTDWDGPAYASPNANRFGPQNQENVRRAFFQMRCDGTNLYWDYSPDYSTFVNIGSYALATYLGGVPDQFGLGGNAPDVSKFGYYGFQAYHDSLLNRP